MTDIMIELDPGQILASKVGIDWVERGTGGQAAVVSYWGGGIEHKITYPSVAEAIAAVDDWLATVNAPLEPPGPLKVGDQCLVSHHTHARGALGEQVAAILVAFPTLDFPYWVILVKNATLYADNVTVSKAP